MGGKGGKRESGLKGRKRKETRKERRNEREKQKYEREEKAKIDSTKRKEGTMRGKNNEKGKQSFGLRCPFTVVCCKKALLIVTLRPFQVTLNKQPRLKCVLCNSSSEIWHREVDKTMKDRILV